MAEDIWDLMRRRRPANARLRHIAHIGATTFGWTFVNRSLPVPEPAPYIELDALRGQTCALGRSGLGGIGARRCARLRWS